MHCGRWRCRTETSSVDCGRHGRSEACAQDDAETIAQRVQLFDSGHVIHQPEGVAVDIELAAFEPRPGHDTDTHQPIFKARITPFALRRVDRMLAALARIVLPHQIADDRRLVLLHQIPQRHVDRHAVRLNLRHRLWLNNSTSAAPGDIGGRHSGTAIARAAASSRRGRLLRSNRRRLLGRDRASDLRRCRGRSIPCRSIPSRGSHRRGKRQTNACAGACAPRRDCMAIGCCWSPDRRYADRKRVWEISTQHHEAGQFGPGAVGDEQRIGSKVEQRGLVKLTAPLPDGAHVLEPIRSAHTKPCRAIWEDHRRRGDARRRWSHTRSRR